MKAIKVRIVAGLIPLAALIGFGWIAISPATLSSAATDTAPSTVQLVNHPSDSPWY